MWNLLTGLALFLLPAAAHAQGHSYWTVDLVRTMPGKQAEYLKSIRKNWAGARELAIADGVIVSYRALVVEDADASGEWDVLLMTEYVDRNAYDRREEAFRAIFESDRLTESFTPTTPRAELREIRSADKPLTTIVAAPVD